jgi:carbon storage regulator
MLVLSRKIGQRIVIGEDIEVTVVEVRRDRVKLAFQAPTSVFIHREEVMRRISKPMPHHGMAALASTKAERGQASFRWRKEA